MSPDRFQNRSDPAESTEDRSRLRVVVSGSHGLVGSALVSSLEEQGHSVARLLRSPSPSDADGIAWDPGSDRIDTPSLEGHDAVVHLAGENIAAGRWTTSRKSRIRDSRVNGTRLIADALARLRRPPRVLVNASAIGYYGDRGDETLDESSSRGTGFLAETCEAWEDAAVPARDAGVRVVLLRIGIVLSPKGGALSRMLTPFRFGLGGRLGSGRQFMSWIALEDLVRIIRHALLDDDLTGPVNAVAPGPVRNAEFTRALGRVLGRPTVFPVPATMIRLLFGEMGKDLLLGGARVLPRRLEGSGFTFLHREIEAALKAQLDLP